MSQLQSVQGELYSVTQTEPSSETYSGMPNEIIKIMDEVNATDATVRGMRDDCKDAINDLEVRIKQELSAVHITRHKMMGIERSLHNLRGEQQTTFKQIAEQRGFIVSLITEKTQNEHDYKVTTTERDKAKDQGLELLATLPGSDTLNNLSEPNTQPTHNITGRGQEHLERAVELTRRANDITVNISQIDIAIANAERTYHNLVGQFQVQRDQMRQLAADYEKLDATIKPDKLNQLFARKSDLLALMIASVAEQPAESAAN